MVPNSKFQAIYDKVLKESPVTAPPPTKPIIRPNTKPVPTRKNPLTPERPNIKPRPKALTKSEDSEETTNKDLELFKRVRGL